MGVKQVLKKILPDSIKIKLRLFYNRMVNRRLLINTERHYKDIERKIRERKNTPLRFASYVVFDSTFSAYEIMDYMISNLEKYVPKIVICPDVSRGEKHLIEQYKKTKDFFIKKYGQDYVIEGYDTGCFIDVSDQFDVVYLANPYDVMVNKVHGVEYISTRNLLPIYISYCFQPDKYSHKVMSSKEISLFWRVFAETKYTLRDYQKYSLIKGKNVKLVGYSKMDSLLNFVEKKREKKTIIIAPHHTIGKQDLSLSNFIEYQDFYLELPKIFPQIKFIFRPHPLLFVNMVNLGYWNHSDINEYLKKLEENGIEYSYGGDYFEIFVNSDAIIHDCSSFIVEYLYTGKPCCFLAKRGYKKNFSTLGRKCLKNYFLAFNRTEILNFIDKVVIGGDDILYLTRKSFFNETLTLNYPNVSKEILKEIDKMKQQICMKKVN